MKIKETKTTMFRRIGAWLMAMVMVITAVISGHFGKVVEAEAATTLPSDIGKQIVEAAAYYLGQGYRLGSVGPDRYDCTSLIKQVLKDVGFTDGTIPGNTDTWISRIRNSSLAVTYMGQPLDFVYATSVSDLSKKLADNPGKVVVTKNALSYSELVSQGLIKQGMIMIYPSVDGDGDGQVTYGNTKDSPAHGAIAAATVRPSISGMMSYEAANGTDFVITQRAAGNLDDNAVKSVVATYNALAYARQVKNNTAIRSILSNSSKPGYVSYIEWGAGEQGALNTANEVAAQLGLPALSVDLGDVSNANYIYGNLGHERWSNGTLVTAGAFANPQGWYTIINYGGDYNKSMQYALNGRTYYGVVTPLWRIEAANTAAGVTLTNATGGKGDAAMLYAIYFNPGEQMATLSLKKVEKDSAGADTTRRVSGAVYALAIQGPDISAAIAEARSCTGASSAIAAFRTMSSGNTFAGYFLTGSDEASTRLKDPSTGEDLVINFGQASSRSYRLVEIYTPGEYEWDKNVYSFTLTANGNYSTDYAAAALSSTIENFTSSEESQISVDGNTSGAALLLTAGEYRKTSYGGFVVRKVGDNRGAVSGVRFGVYGDAECSELVQTVTADSEGFAVFTAEWEGTAQKTYYMREDSDDGYVEISGARYMADTTVYPVALTGFLNPVARDELVAAYASGTTGTYFTITGREDATIVNRELVSHSAVKVIDGDASHMIASVELQLRRRTEDGSAENVGSVSVVSAPSDALSFGTQWTDLRKYDDEGNEYIYWAEETAVTLKGGRRITGSDLDKYFVRTTDNDGTVIRAVTTLTNSTVYTQHSVLKEFGNDVAASLVDSITFGLYARTESGGGVNVASVTVDSARDGMRYDFTGLRKYDDDLNEIHYYVEEDMIKVRFADGSSRILAKGAEGPEGIDFAFTVTSDNDGTSVKNVTVITNTTPELVGYVGAYKVSSVSSEPLSGAVFTVYNDEACIDAAGSMTSGEDGLARLVLSGNVYSYPNLTRRVYVKETTAPAGCVLTDTVWTVDVRLARQLSELSADGTAFRVAGPEGVAAQFMGDGEFLFFTAENDDQYGRITVTKYGSRIVSYRPAQGTGYDDLVNASFGTASFEMVGAEFSLYAAEDIYLSDGVTKVYDKDQMVEVLDLAASPSGQFGVNTPLPLGRYRILETMAPTGQVITADREWEVELTYAGQNAVLSTCAQVVENVEQHARVTAYKYDSSAAGEQRVPVGGAVFGLFTDGELVIPVRSDPSLPASYDDIVIADGTLLAVTTTQAGGGAVFDIDLPYGNYYVRELVAPVGYKLSDRKVALSFSAPANTEIQSAEYSFTAQIDNEPVYMELTIVKEAQPGITVPDSATLSGAVFGIYAKNDITSFDGSGRVIYEAGTLVETVSTQYREGDDARAYAVTSPLPLGEYCARELQAPAGFVTDPDTYDFDLPMVQAMAECALLNIPAAAVDKIESQVIVQEKPTSVPIKKTDITTGEEVRGAILEVYYAQSDGSMGEIVIQDGEELRWTSSDTEHIIWGLPAGEYILHEKSAPAQEGYVRAQDMIFNVSDTQVVSDVVELRDDYTQLRIRKTDYVDGQTLNGCVLELIGPEGDICARWTTGDVNDPLNITENGVTWHVLERIPVGTYTLHEAAVPEGYYCMGDVTVTVDEKGAHSEGGVQEGEMVNYRIPVGRTEAYDRATGEQVVSVNDTVTITDRIFYRYLIPGNSYTVKADLMDAATGEQVKDEDGSPISVTRQWVADEASRDEGFIDVDITFSGSILKGEKRTFVVFEDVHDDTFDRDVFAFNDLTDADETVYVPEIGTTLTDDATGTHMTQTDSDTILTDTVHFENLLLYDRDGGELTYTIEGCIYVKETQEILTDGDGRKVRASTDFVPAFISSRDEVHPDAGSGDISMSFAIDADTVRSLAGKSLVAFEYLYLNGVLAAVHASMDDEAQTVRVPLIRTTARDKSTGTHAAAISDTATIVDTVTYEGLVADGREYVVKGRMMVKETQLPLTDAQGREVTGEARFVPGAANGTVNVEFTVDTGNLLGYTLVVFEDLYCEGLHIAAHNDIDSDEQSIIVANGGYVSVVKADTDGVPVQGAQYTIYDKSDGSVAAVLATDEYGRAVSKLLTAEKTDYVTRVPVTYMIRETYAPAGYVLSEEEREFIIDSGVTEFSFTEEIQKGRIGVVKKGLNVSSTELFETAMGIDIYRLTHEYAYLPGVEFAIYSDEKLTEEVCRITTDSEGIAVSEPLSVGRYYITETSTPAGYAKDVDEDGRPAVYTFDIQGCPQSEDTGRMEYVFDVTKNIENRLLSATLTIKKRGRDSLGNIIPLEGVYFGVFSADDIVSKRSGETVIGSDTCIAVIRTNSEGIATLTQTLPAGGYYYRELRCSGDEYILDDTFYPFTVDYENDDVRVDIEKDLINEIKTGRIVIHKKDSAGNALSGAEFMLRCQDTGREYIAVSEGNGEAVFSELVLGEYIDGRLTYYTYELTEAKAPAGYERDDRVYTLSFEGAASEEKELVIDEDRVNEKTPAPQKKPEPSVSETPYGIEDKRGMAAGLTGLGIALVLLCLAFRRRH